MAVNRTGMQLHSWYYSSGTAMDLAFDFTPVNLRHNDFTTVVNYVDAEKEALKKHDLNFINAGADISDSEADFDLDVSVEDCRVGFRFPINLMNEYVPEREVVAWDLTDRNIVDVILGYWGDKCDLTSILTNEHPSELSSFIPDRLSVAAANFVTQHLESLHLQDARIIARIVGEYFVKCHYLTSVTGARAALAAKEWIEKFKREHGAGDAKFRNLDHLDTQASNLIENLFGSNVQVTKHQDPKLTDRRLRSFEPVALYGSKWFPTGERFWANMWRLYFYNKIDASALSSIIRNYSKPDGCMSKEGSTWYPVSPYHLHMMHQILFCKYNVYIISGYVTYFETSEKGTIPVTVPCEYAYDKIPSHIRNWYNSTFHRPALLASFETHKEWKLGNPIHRHRTDSKVIHSVQTEFSRHALFWWLQKVVFIVNKKQIATSNFWIETIRITIGTFITNLAKCEFGLVTDVISEKWSIDLDRNDMNFEEFANYLQSNLKKIQSNTERIQNDLIHPIWEVQVLPLQWKFGKCYNLEHDHFNATDQELFISVNSSCETWQQVEQNLIKQIQVNDDFRIGNLRINDGIASFPDPNSHLEGYESNFEYDWIWNFVIINEPDRQQVCYTLLHNAFYDFLLRLNDPYFILWPGCVRHPDPAPGNMTVCPYTFNADGYHISASENNVRTRESIKQHYISLNDHLLRNNIVSSLGVLMEDSQNDPFYTVMEGDMLRCMFKGVDCENGLRVFCIPVANCSDSKEIKINTGIIGPISDRNDYSTTFSKYQDTATLKALHERHYAHNLSQLHLNKMRVSVHAFIPFFVGINWHRVKKNITHLDLSTKFIQKFRNKIKSSIEILKRKAGIALKGIPSLSFLPSVNLAVAELMHNTIDGILGAIASVAIDSIKHIKNNAAMFRLYDETFRHLAYENGYRSSLTPSTHLFRGGGKGLKTSKAINTYISSFTLGVVGDALGVDPAILSTLRKMLTWLGLFHSPTLTGAKVVKLVNLCDEICQDIEKIPKLAKFFWNKGRIRVWRNLNQIKLFWLNSADRFIGMIFERLNKLSRLRDIKMKQQNKSAVLTQHTILERAIKDLETIILDNEGQLGSGFIELFQQDEEYCWLLHKLLKYCLDDNGEFHLNRNADIDNCTFDSKFIKLMKVKNINASLWINICNKLKSNDEENADDIIEARELTETNQMKRLNISQFWNNMDYILHFLFEWESEAEFDNIRSNFIIGLQDGSIEVSHTKGMSLFYREWGDCHVRCKKDRQDIVWIKSRVAGEKDGCAQLCGIFHIKGLCSNELLSRKINQDCSNKPNNFVLCLGYRWLPLDMSKSLNYENYDFESTPLVRPTSDICVFDAADIVMKMFCSHDHLIPSKENLRWMHNAIDNFPRMKHTHFPSENCSKIPHRPELVKYWCGFGIECLCDAKRVNCEVCECRPGKIVISCLSSEWRVFRLFGIYQGLIWRYFTTKGVYE